MLPAHLESVLFTIDGCIQISMGPEELGRTDVAYPTGDVIAAEVMAVMAVHENMSRFLRRWADCSRLSQLRGKYPGSTQTYL